MIFKNSDVFILNIKVNKTRSTIEQTQNHTVTSYMYLHPQSSIFFFIQPTKKTNSKNPKDQKNTLFLAPSIRIMSQDKTMEITIFNKIHSDIILY
jgi:hypothetical protein